MRRTGRFAKQDSGYTAFEPFPLPPDPPLRMDDEMARLSERLEYLTLSLRLLHQNHTERLGRGTEAAGIASTYAIAPEAW